MPTFEVQSPDGRKFRIEAPEGASPDEVMAYVQQNVGAPKERTLPEELMRQGGLTARAAVRGASALPLAAGDFINRALNLIPGVNLKLPSEVTDRGLSAVLPTPETGAERIAAGGAEALAGGMPFVAGGQAAAKGAQGLQKAIGEALSGSAGGQALAGAAGGTASATAAELDVGPMGQLAAGLTGSLVPGAAQAAMASGTRGAVRGGEAGRQRYEGRRVDFDEAGVSPTAGQASGNRRTQLTESTLFKAPGGEGVMTRKADKIAEQMSARVDEISRGLMPSADSTKAGLTIEKGIKGFVGRFRAEQKFLYDKVDQFIPPDARVLVSNLQNKLDEMTTPIAGAESISAGMMNPTIEKMRQLLETDAKLGALPYDAVKKLRTTIGEKIGNPTLTDDIGTARWKQIYGALSDDMQTAARASGPEAERAYSRASWFTRAGHDRIESVLHRVSGKDTAEKVYQAAVSPSEIREGGTTIAAVMRSLEPAERQAVTAATIKRLGQALPGQQGAEGGVFSPATFLTGWNKISPQARAVLFPDTESRAGLEALAKAAERIKESSQVFANPSGTVRAGAALGTYGGLGLSALTGDVVTAGKILGGIASANIGARLLTNPKFVKWAGQATKVPAAMLPAQLNFLAQQARNWSDEDRQAVEAFIQTLQSEPR